ncbi:MAG TPA: glycoside hydrolase family 88 protein [Chitinophagaceae bacterium]|nr:glycoside hydrolase family 88 protein [Chitinophagaceae bacterium]
MKYLKIFQPAIILLIGAFIMHTRVQAQQSMDKLIAENMQLAAQQYKLLGSHTPADSMPRHYDPQQNKWVNSNTKWWCSGFYPGSLWLIYEYTKDEIIRKEAEKRLAILEKEKHYTGNHDLGFMMYCSFGTAYRITGNATYKTAVDTAALSLATRYRPNIQSIQSWDSNDKLKCPVIIDNMMNLELLMWVAQHGGDPKLKEIALTHANSTLERHFRPDGSSYHVLDYDPVTSKLIRKLTWQGAADESAWSRGQSWGFYGFTMMYRFTKDKRYLDQAKKIAAFMFNHPNMPADLVPYWDFNAPGIPNAYRDASAAAINASALLELAQYVNKNERSDYIGKAEKIIRSLSSEKYRAKPGENGGYLLMHCVGNLPSNSEINTTLTYADYYFLEALLRYQQWVLNKK